MRNVLLALALAVSASSAAYAQVAGTVSPGSATGAAPIGQRDRAAMQQLQAQMQVARQQERAAMLGALSPAHKALLSQLAGELAVSVTPDYAAAARRLDAALTPAESQAVIRAHQAFKQQSRSLMESARAQFEKTLPPDQAQKMEQHHEQFGTRTEPQPSAGMLLLEPPHMMMKMHGEHPPM